MTEAVKQEQFRQSTSSLIGRRDDPLKAPLLLCPGGEGFGRIFAEQIPRQKIYLPKHLLRATVLRRRQAEQTAEKSDRAITMVR
ncbi:MAG TPA: hypothetical protein VHX86_09095 [Tepidisphaeraceae bacterium]|jgi:hypothetical protein|nr:hypothetical protein [Tepidisphaeraceae bacterium]